MNQPAAVMFGKRVTETADFIFAIDESSEPPPPPDWRRAFEMCFAPEWSDLAVRKQLARSVLVLQACYEFRYDEDIPLRDAAGRFLMELAHICKRLKLPFSIHTDPALWVEMHEKRRIEDPRRLLPIEMRRARGLPPWSG